MSDQLEFPPEPPFDCNLCPRLVGFLEEQRAAHPDWFNGPVPSFGEDSARFLVLGLAPGLQGANKTGRPFTGDYAGDLLYATLATEGFTSGTYDSRPDDGLTLVDAMITAEVLLGKHLYSDDYIKAWRIQKGLSATEETHEQTSGAAAP